MSSTTPVFAGNIPHYYEKYSGAVIFEPFAAELVERIRKDRTRNILELACGTGRVTNHLVKILPEDGSLIATDISADMIEVAKSIVWDPKIKWLLADVHELPFEPERFNHVVCQFGVMFFNNKPKAFSEVYKVLQTGGKFIFNTWDSIENNPRAVILKSVLNEAFTDVPQLITVPNSFYDPNEINKLLHDAGFTEIKIDIVRKISRQEAEDAVAGFTSGSIVSSYLNQKDPVLRETVIQRLKQELINAFGNDHMQFPLQALVCECVK